jgi:hypothetical protein
VLRAIITVTARETGSIPAQRRVCIGKEATYRLAERPASGRRGKYCNQSILAQVKASDYRGAIIIIDCRYVEESTTWLARYTILKYHRAACKRFNDQKVLTTPAPASVPDKSVAGGQLPRRDADREVLLSPARYIPNTSAWPGVVSSSKPQQLGHLGQTPIDLFRPIDDAQHQHHCKVGC